MEVGAKIDMQEPRKVREALTPSKEPKIRARKMPIVSPIWRTSELQTMGNQHRKLIDKLLMLIMPKQQTIDKRR